MIESSVDVLLLYGPTWDAPSQMSKQHLARYWAKFRKVLYVEAPPNILSFVTRRSEALRMARRALQGPKEVAERLWLWSPFSFLPYRGGKLGFGGRWVNTLNQMLVRPQLSKAIGKSSLQDPVLFVGSATCLPLIDRIPHQLLVYHCSDDYTLVPTFPRSFNETEAELIRRCDLVIATAEELKKAKASLNPNTHTVTNGADIAHFAQTQEPTMQVAPEVAALPGPVVGYIGSVFQWIDQDMVLAAARAHPAWSFVFVGPIQVDVSALQSMPNIHFLGPRPYQELPRYLKGFDAVTVPFAVNDVTLRASPIKFYEYLASGVPIVATRLPDFEPYSDFAELVSGPEEFSVALERAIAEETPEKKAARMAESHNHSWEARFQRIDQLIEEALAARTAPSSSGGQ